MCSTTAFSSAYSMSRLFAIVVGHVLISSALA